MPPVITPAQRPMPKRPKYPSPVLRLQVLDLSDEGAKRFLNSVPVGDILQNAVTHVLSTLYPAGDPWPSTRSITLYLESMGGVAYTTGMRLDDDHKEIHFSTTYIAGIAPARLSSEIHGVIFHEMVHCWQYNGKSTCPGGLIEGIADYVRLKAGYVPPHWKRESTGNWDAGYQTTGYWLDWLDHTYGEGAVVRVNEELRDKEYKEKTFWKKLFGKDVEELWSEYGKWLSRDSDDDSSAAAPGTESSEED